MAMAKSPTADNLLLGCRYVKCNVADGTLQEVRFAEGQGVKKGDPLVDIDARPYELAMEQAQGKLARDQALLNGALDLVRYKTLLATNAISKQQYDAQDASFLASSGPFVGD